MQPSLGGKTSLTKILSDYRAIAQTNGGFSSACLSYGSKQLKIL